MVKEAVCKRSAELLVKQDKHERDFGSFLCQAIGVAFPIAGEQSMSF
jgi:uncharacterized protein YbaR (Trm112 family)